MSRFAIPFAQQRIMYFVLLFGMTAYAIAAAVVLQMNEGVGLSEQPVEILETLVAGVGAAMAVTAILLRLLIRNRAEKMAGEQRAAALFASVLLPLATLEGGCLFAITVWMVNGNAVPSLAVALVLLSLAIAVVPFSDPNAG